MLGITGESGSGKSTLIDIMIGLIKPDSGEIIINGKPSTKELFKNFQSHVSYIPQDCFLIDSSILENIALGIEKEKVDINKVKRAIKASSLEDFISKLPDNIETKIGQNGLKISGGQRQRISIARSLYHDRKFIVMDEGTSALDNKTEKNIIDSLSLLKKENTILMVAHRLSSLKYCDKILYLQKDNFKIFKGYDEMINSLNKG